MNKTDKVIAIGGIALIVILAIVAIVLLLGGKNDSPIKVTKEVQTVELAEESSPVLVPVTEESDEMVYNGPVVSNYSDSKEKTVTNTGKAKSVVTDGKYVPKKLVSIKNTDAQMAELFGYWNDSRLEAVYDLINLERVRNLTRDLEGTDGFYYYGELNANNKPTGTGLAIYADDTYYFGQWKDGLREGTGILLQIFPDKNVSLGDYNAIKEHFYTGSFKADLPNGKGQENYVYDVEEISGQDYIVNAIGGFKNGYYDSEMIIYTIDKYGNRYEWRANADAGSFILREPSMVSTTGKRPVWEKGNDNDHSTDESDNGYFWLKEEDNKNWGVFGLMK